MALTLPSDVCGLCGGTLLVGPRIADQTVGPCPRCLSLPVDGALMAFVREWLGFDLWDNPDGVGPWDSGDYNGDRVPLYLPAGTDLGVRWLAKRNQFTDTDAPRFRWLRALLDGPVMWSLSVWHDDPDRARCAFFAADGHKVVRQHAGERRPLVIVPGLATIPTDAPPRLRAARALKLCIEAAP